MNKYLLALFFLIAILAAPFHADSGNYKEVINTGSWNIPQLDNLLARASRISDTI